VVKEENRGLFDVLRIQRQELAEKTELLVQLQKKVAHQRKRRRAPRGGNEAAQAEGEGVGDQEGESKYLSVQVMEQEKMISRLLVENQELSQNLRIASFLEDKERCSDNVVCSICQDRVKCIAFVPCGHLCSCELCSLTLSECPVCRTPITMKCRIFV